VCFLLAHLAYLRAFTRVQPLLARRGPFAAYAVVAAAVLALLWPGIPTGLRGPVVAYVLCLAAMAAWTAVGFLFRHDYAVYAGLGSVLAITTALWYAMR